jgi:hypothetical protein
VPIGSRRFVKSFIDVENKTVTIEGLHPSIDGTQPISQFLSNQFAFEHIWKVSCTKELAIVKTFIESLNAQNQKTKLSVIPPVECETPTVTVSLKQKLLELVDEVDVTLAQKILIEAELQMFRSGGDEQ